MLADGAGEYDAGAFAPYSPAWLFCLAISAIVNPFWAGEPVFFMLLPDSNEAKASPPAGFLAAAPPILAAGDVTVEPGVEADCCCLGCICTEVK